MTTNHRRTRIKLCGFTRPQDIVDAVNLGVDAIGMVFYRSSKRFVKLEQAQQLRQLIPAFVSCTALFVNPEAELVESVINTVQPDLLQFHGDELPSFCASFNHSYIKAFRVGAPGQDTATSLTNFCSRYNDARAWLFDSYTADYGGSGQSFNDDLLTAVVQMTSRPELILSGGLKVDTVATRINISRPFAVDASSAVESAPGIKDRQKMLAFITAVQNSDNIVK